MHIICPCGHFLFRNKLLASAYSLYYSAPELEVPTLPRLLSFHSCSNQRNINIPEEIGIHYRSFGILLLNDERGNLVENIVHDERHNGAACINLMILKRWVNGTGRPVTWRVLVEVLKDIELGELAREIEEVLRHCCD